MACYQEKMACYQEKMACYQVKMACYQVKMASYQVKMASSTRAESSMVWPRSEEKSIELRRNPAGFARSATMF